MALNIYMLLEIITMNLYRYRLELQVNDSTESTIFVLFAEVAEQLAQLKLDDLTPDLENTGRDSDLPKQLQHIIGSKHIFQVKLSSYFERRGVQSFTAHKILKPVVKVFSYIMFPFFYSSLLETIIY
ncbi:putative nucleic acid-binding protein [Medicago truncatula]|uniref:Putative nucleic acid-binding protein n=1 Tax=Medicago truncatula TaxID=3880 RepID=A0A396I6T2_MEDTR|nr:putative nucleic acid-binding protein [Medicago truncatula]